MLRFRRRALLGPFPSLHGSTLRRFLDGASGAGYDRGLALARLLDFDPNGDSTCATAIPKADRGQW